MTRIALWTLAVISLACTAPCQTVDDVWFELGGSASPRELGLGIYSEPVRFQNRQDVLLDPSGRPEIITYQDDRGTEFWVWDGVDWILRDRTLDIILPTGANSRVSVSDAAYDSLGRLWVTWGAALGVNVAVLEGETWNWVGASGPPEGGISEGHGFNPRIAIDPDDRPIVVYQSEDHRNTQIYVRRWTGTEWVGVGDGVETERGISDSDLPSTDASLAVDSSGNPWVAWKEGDWIYLRRWDGNSWVDVGGSSTGTGISTAGDYCDHPTLHFGMNGLPVAAWLCYTVEGYTIMTINVHLKQWNGVSWVELGGSATDGGVTDEDEELEWIPTYDMRLDSGGFPCVVYERPTRRGSTDHRILLRRWDGSQWSGIGGSDQIPDGITLDYWGSQSPWLLITSDDLPVVFPLYSERIFARGFSGSEWVSLGPGSSTYGGVSNTREPSERPAVAINSAGHPLIAWSDMWYTGPDNPVYLRQWDGAQWTDLIETDASGEAIFDETSTLPRVAFTHDGNPVVAWVQGSQSGLYLRRWNGTSWEELGGSATGHGLFELTDTGLFNHRVMVDSQDRIAVAWTSRSLGNRDIQLKRWNGSAWEELDGSATGGGVSRTGEVDNEWPLFDMAIDHRDNPIIVWDDIGILLRRWNGVHWEELAGSATGMGLASAEGVAAERPALMIDQLGNPVVAFTSRESSGYPPAEIHVTRWAGSEWEWLGDSDNPFGIPLRDGDRTVGFASMVPSPSGEPIVAWNSNSSESVASTWNVLVARWNGETWVDIGEGSAGGTGITGLSGGAALPVMACSPGGTLFVGWEQSDLEIFLRATDLEAR